MPILLPSHGATLVPKDSIMLVLGVTAIKSMVYVGRRG